MPITVLKKHKLKRFILFLLLGLTHPIQADEPIPLHIAFMDYTFAEVSKEDTKVAVDFYLQKLLYNTGNKPFAMIFSELDVLKQALQNKDVLMASMSTPDFLRLAPDSLLKPILTRVKTNGDISDTFVILVHKNKNWTALQDLKNPSVRIQQNDILAKYWLQVALARAQHPQALQFFSAIEQDVRPSQSILSVFFGKSDVCVVNTAVFEAMSQLNPQIAQKLVPILTSPKFLTGFLCTHVEMPIERQDVITKASLALSQSEDGRQVIRLFKTKEIVPFQDAYIKTVVDLFDQHKKYYGTTELSF